MSCFNRYFKLKYGLALGYDDLNDLDILRQNPLLSVFCKKKRIAWRIHAHWKEIKIIIRGDSGFCREAIMNWCEENHVGHILSLAKNGRLNKRIHADLVDPEIMYRTLLAFH